MHTFNKIIQLHSVLFFFFALVCVCLCIHTQCRDTPRGVFNLYRVFYPEDSPCILCHPKALRLSVGTYSHVKRPEHIQSHSSPTLSDGQEHFSLCVQAEVSCLMVSYYYSASDLYAHGFNISTCILTFTAKAVEAFVQYCRINHYIQILYI